MRKKQLFVPVSYRALYQRVDRVLAKKGQRLRVYRGGSKAGEWLGDLFIVDTNLNVPVEGDVDLEALGKELGVLEPFERFEEREKP
jgi:hypothetical protein